MTKRNYKATKINYQGSRATMPVLDEVAELSEEIISDIEEVAEPMEEIAEPVEEDEIVDSSQISMFGFVSGCTKLNIRKEPRVNAEIVYVVDSGTDLMIDPADSTDEWLHVCNYGGIEGYCMKKYVTFKD